MPIIFKYEYYPTKEEIIGFIQYDEGRSIQQTVYSTFHNAITQINFTKKIIRSNIKLK
jgi:hypothetical protein